MTTTVVSLETKREEAGYLITVFSFAHSAVALTLANTLVGDTVILTGLTFWMIQKIGGIYNCNNLNPWKIMGKVVGFCAGVYIVGKLLFWLPGIGNWANATATFIVTQAIGWTCVFLMESFDDPSKATSEDWNRIMEKARHKGEEAAEENELLLKKMTSKEKARFKELNSRVRKEELTEQQKQQIFEEMDRMRKEIIAR